MNPARTFGPDLASTTFTSYWVYIAGPLAGAAIAVVIAFVLRGRGGGKSGARRRPRRPVHRGLRVRQVLSATAAAASYSRVITGAHFPAT